MSSKEKQGVERWQRVSQEDRVWLERVWELSHEYKNDYTPNIEAGLSKLKFKMNANSPAQNRPAKVVTIKPRSRWWQLAATIVLLIGVGFVFKNFLNSSSTWQVIQTSENFTKKISLQDGSQVWLNENSQLSFPKTFDAMNRTVKLEGEAFFEVAKDTERPFFINMKEGDIQVLGTAFNVQAYPKMPDINIHVEEGSVAFASKSGVSEILKAFDKACFSQTDNKLKKWKDDTFNSFAWRTKELRFRNTPMNEVLEEIKQFFDIDIDIEIEAGSLDNCHCTATIRTNVSTETMQSLELAFNGAFKFQKISEKKYKVTGKGCPK